MLRLFPLASLPMHDLLLFLQCRPYLLRGAPLAPALDRVTSRRTSPTTHKMELHLEYHPATRGDDDLLLGLEWLHEVCRGTGRGDGDSGHRQEWLWQFEYPDGTRTLNELHVPVNKPVQLVMHSEDVLHGFFVPSFRLKRDVIPGRYTQLWFTATEPGVQQVFCAEYCGKGHSDMLAKIFVDTDEQYETFLREGDEQVRQMPLKDLGRLVYENKGCATCHSIDGTRSQGPSWKGIYGKMQMTPTARAIWWTKTTFGSVFSIRFR